MSRITVVIPTYNRVGLLREAIESVLAQEGLELELIVVDDGSTDSTPDLLAEYGDRLIALRQNNLGATAARNNGLAAASGELIKFLDADDVLLPGALSIQLQFWSDCAHIPQATRIVFGEMQEFGGAAESVRPSYYPKLKEGDTLSLCDLIVQSPITSMPLFPVGLLRDVGGFDLSLPCNDEYDLHLRLFLAGGRFIYHPDVVYAYRHHDGERLSRRRLQAADLEQLYLNYEGHYRAIAEHQKGSMSEAVATALARNYWQTGRWGLRSGCSDAAQKFFQRARELSPGAVSGSFLYRTCCRLLGPVAAEKVGQGAKGGERRA